VLGADINEDVEYADEGVTAIAHETFTQLFILNSSTENTGNWRC
jgi:hypothetical protein